MPEYSFECEKCGNNFSEIFSISEYDERIKKVKCSSCKSKKVYRDFAADSVSSNYVYGLSECKTVQQYAEKQTKLYGKEKTQKMIESFKTKSVENELPSGMTRVKTAKDLKRFKPNKKKGK